MLAQLLKESNCPQKVSLIQVGSHITAFQVGWCTGPAPGLGLGEAFSQQSQGVLVEGITPHISAQHQGEVLLDKVPWSLRQGLLSTTPGRNVNEKKNYGNRRNS